jgi:hypothetical protein
VTPRTLLLGLAATASLGLAACGSGDSKRASSPKQISNAQAATEVAYVSRGVEAALATYTKGRRATAAEQVANLYLEHFEKVEGPLGKVDEALKERLEELLSTDLRNKMKSGAPVTEVRSLVITAKRDLALAAAKLQ